METLAKISAIVLLSSGLTIAAKAQQGFGTSTPAPSSVIDAVATNKGVLLPRVALTSTSVAAPITAPANSLTVFNTATTGDVTPGYYYWSQDTVTPVNSKWVRMLTGTPGPFQVESTTTKATTNTQNIYQNGNLGLGDFSASNPVAKLDVRGAVRGGTGNLGTVGTNSATFGTGNTASGTSSVAGGADNIASGVASIAFGVGNSALANDAFASGSGNTVELGANNSFTSGYANTVKADAWSSFVTGQENTVHRTHGFASGYLSTVKGPVGAVFGYKTTSSSPGEFVLGVDNAVKTGTSDNHIPTDALFQVGNGFFGPNNAITVLRNAHTAIGVDGAEATSKPTELLDLGGTATAGNGGLKIRNINSVAYTGNAATDKTVVADVNGVLKTVNKQYSTTTAFPTGETWIDGKKVYKKVYAITLASALAPFSIDPNLGPILSLEFAMKLDVDGVYKRITFAGYKYDPATGAISVGSSNNPGLTFPVTLNLVVTYVEP